MVRDLVNLVEARVRTEDLRNDDSVRGLVVLEEGGHHAWESKA